MTDVLEYFISQMVLKPTIFFKKNAHSLLNSFSSFIQAGRFKSFAKYTGLNLFLWGMIVVLWRVLDVPAFEFLWSV